MKSSVIILAISLVLISCPQKDSLTKNETLTESQFKGFGGGSFGGGGAGGNW